jgi:hypothetical protein
MGVPLIGFQDMLDHLIKLAKTPGWKSYAWHRAKQLEGDPTGAWAGMAEALTKAMKGGEDKAPSENP